MRARIVVIGGGEHARVIIEAIRTGSAAQDVIGFVDPESCEETVRRLEVPRLGDEDALERHEGALGVLGFGSLEGRERRREAVRRLSPVLSGWASVVHPSAQVSPTSCTFRRGGGAKPPRSGGPPLACGIISGGKPDSRSAKNVR